MWVCPRCGNYYGASNAGNLDKLWNRDAKGRPTHRRAQCPTCHIRRKPYRVTIEVPEQ